MPKANFMPQDDFLVTQAELLTDLDRKTLTYLYQPLVGAVAAALYAALWTMVKPRPMFTRDRQPHTILLGTLAVSADELYNARIRLEAVGLLKTYTQFDTERHYVYEMFAPLRPEKFFADDLLSIALYDSVGAERYLELSGAFTVTPVRRSDMHDITKTFTDVFNLSPSLASVPSEVQTVREATEEPARPVAEIDVNKIDWELLQRKVAGMGLNDGELQAKQHAIAQVAGFYGLDTSSLALLVGRSIDILTGEINAGVLRREAEQSYSRPDNKRLSQQEVNLPATAAAETATTTAKAPGAIKLSADEASLVARAKTMPVREFLEATKKATNSKMFVADNERFAVQKLLDRNVFSAATINVLVYYVLHNRENISAAYLNSVANSWIKAKVETPEQAVVAIREFRTAPNAAGQKHRRANYGRQQRKEPVPSWAEKDYQAPKKPVTSTTLKELAEKRAKLQNTGKRDQ